MISTLRVPCRRFRSASVPVMLRAATPMSAETMRQERQWSGLLIGVGTLPFAAGLCLSAMGLGGLPTAGVSCVFRATVGLPCPLCGATRAVLLAGQGDPDFVRYNAVWPVVLAACAVVGTISLAAAAFVGAAPLQAARKQVAAAKARRPLTCAVLPFALALVPWAYALANRSAILS